VEREFDRVSSALARHNRVDIIEILEEKRREVMAIDHAGYFIRHWGELSDQVSRMIRDDPRYAALRMGAGHLPGGHTR
jgi:hypothetical protein